MRLKPLHFAGLFLTVSALLLAIAWWAQFEPQVVLPEMTVQEKKQRFRAIVAPAVSEVYLDLMQQYQDVSALVQSGDNAKKLSALRAEYKVTSDAALLMALKPHPRSIAMAQAAMADLINRMTAETPHPDFS